MFPYNDTSMKVYLREKGVILSIDIHLLFSNVENKLSLVYVNLLCVRLSRIDSAT